MSFPMVRIAPLCLRMTMFIRNRKEVCVVWMFERESSRRLWFSKSVWKWFMNNIQICNKTLQYFSKLNVIAHSSHCVTGWRDIIASNFILDFAPYENVTHKGWVSRITSLAIYAFYAITKPNLRGLITWT